MPSTNQAADSRERERSDDPHADEAYRWLDREVLGEPSREQIVRSLIQGMDRIARVRTWDAAERSLGRGEDGGPRTGIVRALQQREDELHERGERPDRLRYGPREPCDCCDGEGLTADEVRAQRAEERERRVGAGYTTESAVEQQSDDETEASTLGAFATDGGEAET